MLHHKMLAAREADLLPERFLASISLQNLQYMPDVLHCLRHDAFHSVVVGSSIYKAVVLA